MMNEKDIKPDDLAALIEKIAALHTPMKVADTLANAVFQETFNNTDEPGEYQNLALTVILLIEKINVRNKVEAMLNEYLGDFEGDPTSRIEEGN